MFRSLHRAALLLLVAAPALAAQGAPPAAPAPAPLPFRLRGYLQVRYNRLFETESQLSCASCDRSIGGSGGIAIRRARIGFSATPSPRAGLYLSWDLSTEPSSYAQMRDAYLDVLPGGQKALRIRMGQHIIPISYEAVQSSAVRVPFDRSDAVNSGLNNERDIGVTVSWAPTPLKDRWSDLGKRAQKGAGDYGVVALSVYNGQTTNKPERNLSKHGAVRLAYPFAIGGQVLEVGGSAYAGRFVMDPATVTPGVAHSRRGYDDRRVGATVILYPRPFGIAAEYVTGEGPEYDVASNAIRTKPLEGGYLLLTFRRGAGEGFLTPYVRGQYYEGGKKVEQDARRYRMREYEAGIEWQVDTQLEFTAAWTESDRRYEDGLKPDNHLHGSFVRLQAQVLY
jgi:hypothetical protein